MALRAEIEEARLVRMQRKAEPAKPLPQHVHDPLGGEDIYHNSYKHGPLDGSAWGLHDLGHDVDADGSLRVVRGGSWYYSGPYVQSLRAAYRLRYDTYYRDHAVVSRWPER
jgi:formylglycine-generating enzyme required for sulfatase activity